MQISVDYILQKCPTDTINLINQHDFYLLLSVGPGSKTKIKNDLQNINGIKLIIIDQTFTYDILKFDHFNVAAEILHEVGHFLNKQPNDKKNEEEFYADDFARSCCLGLYLKLGLEKYLKKINSVLTPINGAQNKEVINNF
ncbi:MAG: hypothetical protein WCG45_06205, partial [bacterium]